MAIKTALTETLGLEYPIILAPMASVSGGQLAAAVSNAGALGLVGGGYGNRAGTEKETEFQGLRPLYIFLPRWTEARKVDRLSGLSHAERHVACVVARVPLATARESGVLQLVERAQPLRHRQYLQSRGGPGRVGAGRIEVQCSVEHGPPGDPDLVEPAAGREAFEYCIVSALNSCIPPRGESRISTSTFLSRGVSGCLSH